MKKNEIHYLQSLIIIGFRKKKRCEGPFCKMKSITNPIKTSKPYA